MVIDSDCRREDCCRSCRSNKLDVVLDLGETPLANRLVSPEELGELEPRFPLVLAFCNSCGLVQILHTINPDILFRDYVYFSSFSDALLAHSREHALQLIGRLGLGEESLVVEAASNDGYLLQYFQEAGVQVLGVEPARNIAKKAVDKGIPTRAEFFSKDYAQQLVAEGTHADVVIGNNVLAHVADLNGFLAGAVLLLKEAGVVEFEFPYVGDLIGKVEFDTIYHEHLCYFSVHAIEAAFQRHGLILTDVAWLPIHGGSLRVTGTRQARDSEGIARVEQWKARERERGMDKRHYYADFGQRVADLRERLVGKLRELKEKGNRIAAYGASAKGSTLLNVLGIDSSLLEFVVDRSTVKQGMFTPGTHLPIFPPEKLIEDQPEYTLLLTWNFAEEILAQQEEYRAAGGKFVIPLPDVQVV